MNRFHIRKYEVVGLFHLPEIMCHGGQSLTNSANLYFKMAGLSVTTTSSYRWNGDLNSCSQSYKHPLFIKFHFFEKKNCHVIEQFMSKTYRA